MEVSDEISSAGVGVIDASVDESSDMLAWDGVGGLMGLMVIVLLHFRFVVWS